MKSLLCFLTALMFSLPAAAQDNAPPRGQVVLHADSKDSSAGELPAFQIETSSAIYYLEKSGAGLSSLLDRDGNDWLGFNPKPGSRAGGEYRGFPNAVHQQAGNYFHAKNSGTEPSEAKVELAASHRVTISALSSNQLWACQYDFYPSHATFTMTRMPSGKKYWVLYEGTPGGQFDDTDWWMTSGVATPQPMSKNHEGDIPPPEWIVFGDPKVNRVLFLLHHEDDAHPDRFYQMDRQMTVFGFGRQGIAKFLDSVPQRFSIGFLETTNHVEIAEAMRRLLDGRASTE